MAGGGLIERHLSLLITAMKGNSVYKIGRPVLITKRQYPLITKRHTVSVGTGNVL